MRTCKLRFSVLLKTYFANAIVDNISNINIVLGIYRNSANAMKSGRRSVSIRISCNASGNGYAVPIQRHWLRHTGSAGSLQGNLLYFNKSQIGYARVISDFSTVAYLGDVYVLPDFRGRGLSKWLMKTIMEYPELQGLRRWILSTADAHGLYKQFGWVPVAYPERWMEVHNREVYSHIKVV